MCSMTGMNNALNIIRLIILPLGVGQALLGLSHDRKDNNPVKVNSRLDNIAASSTSSFFFRQICAIWKMQSTLAD